MSNYINDDAHLEMEAADDRHAEHECHANDEELAAYYAKVDASRPLPVIVRRRIAVDARYFEGITKQLGAVMALFGGGR